MPNHEGNQSVGRLMRWIGANNQNSLELLKGKTEHSKMPEEGRCGICHGFVAGRRRRPHACCRDDFFASRARTDWPGPAGRGALPGDQRVERGGSQQDDAEGQRHQG